jgi:hypothetical protein
MVYVATVEKLSDFISCISDLHCELKRNKSFNCDGNGVLLYRGHSNCNFKLQASIYRDENYIKHESQIYKDVLHNFPNYFKNKNDIVDNLIKMQHYGIPTRLIDLTFNPLVALFFACGGYDGNMKENGEILIFLTKQKSISFSDDVSQLLMTGLNGQVNYKYCFATFYAFNKLLRKIDELKNRDIKPNLNNKLEELSEKIKGEYKKDCGDPLVIDSIICNVENHINSFFKHSENNIQDDERKLLNEIKDFFNSCTSQGIKNLAKKLNSKIDISEFDKISSFFQQFLRGFLIKPRMNFERIRRQQGAFLIHSPVYLMNPKIYDWVKNNDISVYKFRIENSSKDRILSELAQNGITYSFLFPELYNYSREIEKITM